MGLSCICNYDDYDFYYYPPKDYLIMPWFSRRKRCPSCEKIINKGELVGVFKNYRRPINDIEERIHCDEVPLAKRYLCEDCVDIFFNLEELGYCLDYTDNMKELLEEYKENLT